MEKAEIRDNIYMPPDWKRPYIAIVKVAHSPCHGCIGILNTLLCGFCELSVAYA